MATNREILVEQRRRLFALLRIRKANPGMEIKELNNQINAVIAEMEQEDVAWVEKKIAELT